MRARNMAISAVGFGLLILAVVLTFFIPGPLTPKSVLSVPSNDSITITGIVRDFRASHPDFAAASSVPTGHYAGNVAQQLTPNGVPAFIEPISAVTDFEVVDGVVIPRQDFATQITVLGSALESGSYHCPTTMRATVGSAIFEPFGPYDKPVDGNLNDRPEVTGSKVPGSNPRDFVLPDIYEAGTRISIEAQSWLKSSSGVSGTSNSHWDKYLSSDSSKSNTRVYALRDGDPVPDTPGLNEQASIAEYVSDYVDTDTDTIRLKSNEVIYLFELGVTDLKSPAADFQDMVVLITLASHPSYFEQQHTDTGSTSSLVAAGAKVHQQWRDRDGRNIAPHLASSAPTDSCGRSINDTTGAFGGPGATGISSADTFDQWFRNRLGVNQAGIHSITLVNDGSGVYEYSTDSFYPVDDRMFGNEGDEHNRHFTYSFDVRFQYDACSDQFLQFSGTDDAWVFVNGRLAMDLGGVIPGAEQYVMMDRLGLTDGQSYDLKFFYAQRQSRFGDFHLRTNILAEPSGALTAGGGYD